ncbi:TonB-dependent receptor [Chitinophaga nivalis]|uniref:TonB-dependent receptor n=1 Tax=Chitinophaga nivalis TaxID=2991709 RepID=A0ABT3IFV7_9BACT|nr:TonB-dependent receptor [Chitinophaga nivalis]MCW3467659.1 TonB-dependent receptor [Chitinophaga nivalis]MCW3482649.1 TonB-dependent receptor [Chitinophaga nivalis]
MRKLLPTLLCCCFSFIYWMAAAQTPGGTVKGKITTSDNKPAAAVSVLLRTLNKTALSDDDGNFVIPKVKPGQYTLEVSLMGHHATATTVDVEANRTTEVTIQLQTAAQGLNEVVVTSAATRFAKKQSEYVARMQLSNLENPQVYTVIPKELFTEQIVTDFKSALQMAPGVSNVTQGVGSGGIGLSIRMRGFSGANAGGAIRNGMATNWVSMSDPVNLESIEVIKGPSGTLFGGVMLSYGGLVNRVTKKPLEDTRLEIGYTGGSFNLHRVNADVNLPLNKNKTILFRLNAAAEKQNSFLDEGRSNTLAAAPAFTFKLNKRLTVDVDFELFHTKRNTTYIGSVANTVKAKSFDELNFDFKHAYTNNDLQSRANIFNAFAKVTYRINDQWTSTTSYSYANTDNNANYLFLLLGKEDSMTRRIMHIPSSFGVNQVQQNFNGDFKIGRMRNRLLAGLDYTQVTSTDTRATVNNYDVVKVNQRPADISIDKYEQMLAAMKRTPYDRNYQTYSAYISDVLSITDALLVMASARIDHYNSKGDDYSQTAISPKFGVVYQVVKDKVSLFGNYTNGFTNVPPGLVFNADPKEKTTFKPEHANQLEGGVKLELLNGKLSGTLSYYNIEVKNRVRNDPEHPNYSLQDGTQRSSGFEADLIANPFRGFHAIFGYGYNSSKFTQGDSSVLGLRPTSAPQHTANTWISYKLMEGKLKGLGIGIGGNYQSESFFMNNRTKRKDGSFNKDPFTFMVPSFVKLDATIFYERPKYRVGIKVNNLTNKEYWTSDAWALRESTRQFVFNVSYKIF